MIRTTKADGSELQLKHHFAGGWTCVERSKCAICGCDLPYVQMDNPWFSAPLELLDMGHVVEWQGKMVHVDCKVRAILWPCCI